MDLYNATAQATSRLYTNAYSTSFGLASRMFNSDVRPHIYAIYGLTRIADEIVDTYRGDQTGLLLDAFEHETYQALKQGYSTNPILQSFQLTAHQYSIDDSLLKPFFASMRADITKKTFNLAEYQRYIHGSAEVVGLMCLKVFCDQDDVMFEHLRPAAEHLGAAYQKVNFLRDIAADHAELGRYYFPIGNFKSFDEATKQEILDDIAADFAIARPAFDQLPRSARRAVFASYKYYGALYRKLQQTPAATLKRQRVRVSNGRKLFVLLSPLAGRSLS